MNTESFGPCLLLLLHEDVFAVISCFLSPRDICNLILCCKSLCELVDSEKIWLAQCEVVDVLPLVDIIQWRVGISSYKALTRFLVEVVKPLVGIWVHQNPDLGNVVYVMPGFLSVVGCRIIPQKVGPSWIQEGRVMWSPVFEIICSLDGSAEFFLHGREIKGSCVYPGFVMGIEKSCNVLLLEVEPMQEKSEDESVFLGKKEGQFPFYNLDFIDRMNLLGLVTSHIGIHVPNLSRERLFPSSKDDEAVLLEYRTMLLKMHKFGGNWKHILEKSSSSKSTPPSRSEIIHSNRQSFLSSGNTFGLSLKASYIEISSCQGWPLMNVNNFSLYKLPIKNPVDNQEYAGLWGGTFGWAPLKSYPEDTPGKALFLLMLTYEESQEDNERHLIATKILEGNDYVKYPTGSPLFDVNIDTPSLEPFPFDAYGSDFEHYYKGEGMADSYEYEYRYPGLRLGSLLVISNDLLAFVWQETKHVITLQRLNLEKILKKGLGSCVSPLPPTENFTYMNRSYRNVFA
ncbi:putative F-box protein [Cardamine amara subsp. amara]|uniref:F-box protein n=1 Tax=Cardamine amara subsp. amara TaxID=228776 RepID=A0ABD0ZS19_CARAN